MPKLQQRLFHAKNRMCSGWVDRENDRITPGRLCRILGARTLATPPEGPAGIKSGLLPAMTSGRMPECGEGKMTHSDLIKVEIHGPDIFVAMRGTCFKVRYVRYALLSGPDGLRFLRLLGATSGHCSSHARCGICGPKEAACCFRRGLVGVVEPYPLWVIRRHKLAMR
jgi:hypothetical protein